MVDTHMSAFLMTPSGCVYRAEFLVCVNMPTICSLPTNTMEKQKGDIIRALLQQVSHSTTSIQADLSLFLNKSEDWLGVKCDGIFPLTWPWLVAQAERV